MILHLSKQIEATKLKRIQRILSLSMTLSFLSELVGLTSFSSIFFITLMIGVWCAYYALMFHALKRMLYSFLTLLIILFLAQVFYFVVSLGSNQWVEATLSFLNLFTCAWLVVAVHRPIFFPKINWTEYDFRHRRDRRVRVIMPEGEVENGRLYDQRRGEAALQCFVELELDSEYRIEDADGEFIGQARVLSHRKTLLGRPTTHGIRLARKS